MSTNDQKYYPTLERGQIIPPFTLPGTDSMPHSPWDYKQREHLILLFTQSAMKSEGRGLLCEFALRIETFVKNSAQSWRSQRTQSSSIYRRRKTFSCLFHSLLTLMAPLFSAIPSGRTRRKFAPGTLSGRPLWRIV